MNYTNFVGTTENINCATAAVAANNQQMALRPIPLVIIIFDNGGHISYRAYSPASYNTEADDNAENAEDQYGQFLARVYQRVSYDQTQPLHAATPFGTMKEVHSRACKIQLANRGDTCYFSTYIHPHTPYKPVHRGTPVHFEAGVGAGGGGPTLYSRSCPHEFV